MKYSKVVISLFTAVIILTCAFFPACNLENPIMEKWWVEEEPDYEYVAIIKDVPLLVYETIIEERIIYDIIYNTIYEYIETPPEYVYIDNILPPEVLLQFINIQNIEFILFAGDSSEFNGDHGAGGTTDLKPEEKKTNNNIVDAAAAMLKEDQELFIILHGHANPVSGNKDEIESLTEMSLLRADAVADKILDIYGEGEDALDSRMTTKGYGGTNQISGSNTTYAGLNRRVEIILFRVETESSLKDTKKGEM